SADIDTSPDRRVAEIAQMVRFGFVAELRCFDLNEVANADIIPKSCPAAHTRKRADAAMASNYCSVQMGVRCELASWSYFHIAQHATRAYPNVICKPYFAFKYAIDIDEDSDAAYQFATHIETPGVSQRYAPGHLILGILELMNTFQ